MYYSPEADAQSKQDQRIISNLQVMVRGISTACLPDQLVHPDGPNPRLYPLQESPIHLGGCDHRDGSQMVLRDQVASWEQAFH